MRRAAWVPMAAVLLALGGCDETPRQRMQTQLGRADLARVRREAALTYKDLFAASGSGFIPLPLTKFPPSFRQFQPLRIVAHRDGFALTLVSTAATESGLYIVPAGMEHAPAASRRAHFERLREGFYWYAFE